MLYINIIDWAHWYVHYNLIRKRNDRIITYGIKDDTRKLGLCHPIKLLAVGS